MSRTMSHKKADRIVEKYACSRCWGKLEKKDIGNGLAEVFCQNHTKGLCDGGTGFITASSIPWRMKADLEAYSLVKESYPEWDREEIPF